MPTATIGTGGDYASITAWWTAVRNSATDTYIGEVISDLSGAQSLGGGTNSKTVIVRTDGPRRTITATANTTLFFVGSSVISSLTLEDLTLDGASQGASTSALWDNSIASGGTFIAKRLIMRNAVYGARGHDVSTAFNSEWENCLCYNCSSYGWILQTQPSASTATFKHCGAYNCNYGLYASADTDMTTNVYNSWFLNNSTGDFHSNSSQGSFNGYNCVISKASASNADTFSGGAVSKTAYTDYFTDPANGDFTLKDEDSALWGINSDGSNSPADDLLGETRVNDDIGPYEYLSAPPTISSVTISGTSQVGQTLTATVVTDKDPVDSTAYQWQKAATDDAEPGTDISGETSSTLALTYADFGDLLDTAAYVRCQAIATKDSLDSAEEASAWQAVTVAAGGGSGTSPFKLPCILD